MPTSMEIAERRAMISRVQDLLRMTDPVVTISAKDLKELARAHPALRNSVTRARRENNYWNTEEGAQEAKRFVAEFNNKHGKLPNVGALHEAGLSGLYQSRFGSRKQYIRFLMFEGKYTAEEIAAAGMQGLDTADRVTEYAFAYKH